MGLTKSSVGHGAIDGGLCIQKRTPNEKIIAVAGNPNVGKSTVFNALTGMKQHTGNWPGKTVASAKGYCRTSLHDYVLVDIPGTYSLMAHSAEEEVARNFLCFGNADATVIVCDATCIERNLNLVLQITEISPKTIVCVNLLDEAKRKGITVDLKKLSDLLGVPVVGTIAQKKRTLDVLKSTLDDTVDSNEHAAMIVTYPESIENAITTIENAIKKRVDKNSRWIALKLLDQDDSLICKLCNDLGDNILGHEEVSAAIEEAFNYLESHGIKKQRIKEIVTSTLFEKSEAIAKQVVSVKTDKYSSFDGKIDKLLTSKYLGYPLMLLLLGFIFWLTITAANYPTSLLSSIFDKVGEWLSAFMKYIGSPNWLHSVLLDGVYKVLAWVTAVMLPPMAIFFPLFTLLEDIGYLPRAAYNLDKPFKCCRACGKQALTMCMGFGCNAAGVVGCRIIDSPRERLIAIITNSLVPCNGRFPTLITLISMFFIASSGFLGSITAALLLLIVITIGIVMTFATSKLLSHTVLNGIPSSFVLELPPYRKPQIGKVIIRSIFDRTLFVLGRAVAVAAPAGLIIWLAANISIGDSSILSHCSNFLDPFARLIGLDGVILIAFILGFPANEIVLPIIIMAYLAEGTLVEIESIAEMKELFVQNGWTMTTALCTMIFSLFHWPCSTTMLTIKKETGSLKWSAVAFILPTLIGIILCFIISSVAKLI